LGLLGAGLGASAKAVADGAGKMGVFSVSLRVGFVGLTPCCLSCFFVLLLLYCFSRSLARSLARARALSLSRSLSLSRCCVSCTPLSPSPVPHVYFFVGVTASGCHTLQTGGGAEKREREREREREKEREQCVLSLSGSRAPSVSTSLSHLSRALSLALFSLPFSISLLSSLSSLSRSLLSFSLSLWACCLPRSLSRASSPYQASSK